MRGPLTLSTHDMQLKTFHIQHATGTFDIRHTTCNSQHSIYDIPYTTCHGSIYIQMRGAGAPFFFARELPALSPRSTFKPLGGVEVERFFGGGRPSIFLAPRCCGGAALLRRKEWCAAKARISLVVRRRCCPSSALELKKRCAANACEAGPRRLAMSPHF